MTQSADIQPSSLEEILEILRSEAQSMPPSPTSVRYLRALQSLTSSAHSAPHAPLGFNTAQADTAKPILHTPLTDWLINQWLMSVPYTSASLYLDIISSLYGSAVRAGRLPKTTLFSELKAQLKALGPDGWKSGIDDEIFTRALRLTKNAGRLIADDAIAADLVILSLTHSLQPLEQLAMLQKDSSASSAPPVPLRDIITRHAGSARRKYVFPLRQSERTPLQLKKHVAKIVNALFRRARLPQSTDPNQTVEALWAYAALRTGIPASALVSHLGHAPLGLPILKLSVGSYQLSESGQAAKDDLVGTHGSCVRVLSRECAAGLSSRENNTASADTAPRADTAEGRYCEADTSKNDFSQIGKVFLDNPPRWYAMSLRPGVRFTQVCRRIEILSKSHTAPRTNTPYCEADTPYSSLQLFYPCEEIARAIGKKIVVKQRPFIHSVVFFKARITDIGPLFAKIGDLAWCYRQSAAPGAPYAEISESQFRLFQQTIARFTPDYEVAPAGELELNPNDRVEILGGLFAGHEATVVGTHGSCVRGSSKDRVATEASNLKPEAPSTIYRLNIIGDNGIEWRIHLDSRLTQQKTKKSPT